MKCLPFYAPPAQSRHSSFVMSSRCLLSFLISSLLANLPRTDDHSLTSPPFPYCQPPSPPIISCHYTNTLSKTYFRFSIH
ncbi:hypothetical protein C8J56DRAFT_937940 [Mycena floridula]|nr:hypothetical protein C8J56DRAFT_937940 [Mycena floridula]